MKDETRNRYYLTQEIIELQDQHERYLLENKHTEAAQVEQDLRGLEQELRMLLQKDQAPLTATQHEETTN